MSDLDPYFVPASAVILDAVEKIQSNRSRCVFVIQDGKVVGVVSEGDVMRLLLRGTSVYTVLSEIMNPSFIYLNRRDLKQAFDLFRKHLFTLIPVVDEEFHLQDVISLKDVMGRLRFEA